MEFPALYELSSSRPSAQLRTGAGTHHHRIELLEKEGVVQHRSQQPPRRMGPGLRRDDAVAATIQRDGQIIDSDFRKLCQPLESKIFRFRRRANHLYEFAHPVPLRGALAIVTNEGRGCGGRDNRA